MDNDPVVLDVSETWNVDDAEADDADTPDTSTATASIPRERYILANNKRRSKRKDTVIGGNVDARREAAKIILNVTKNSFHGG